MEARHAIFAVSLLLAFVGFEALWLIVRRREAYPWRDALASIAVGIGQRVSLLATGAAMLPLYLWLVDHRPWEVRLDSPLAWLALFLLIDLLWYAYHRMSHEVRWFWASHSVHHSAPVMNLSTAFRLSWTGVIAGSWLPIAIATLLGFHPLAAAAMYAANLMFQNFVHTQLVGTLGPLEWIFNTPSHHRVHHATQPQYVDKNFAGVLIVWDRLFGTFAREREAPRYGLSPQLGSRNPLWIAFHGYADLLRDLVAAEGWRARWRALAR